MSRKGLVGAVASCAVLGFSMWLAIVHYDIARLVVFIVLYIALFGAVGFMGYSATSTWRSGRRRPK